jgi:hypothetical protein
MPRRTSPLVPAHTGTTPNAVMRPALQTLSPNPMQLFTTVAAMPFGVPFASPMVQPVFQSPQQMQAACFANAAPEQMPVFASDPMEDAVDCLQSIARKAAAVESSAKKGCVEREYSIEDLRRMVIKVLEGKSGGPKKVAEAAGLEKAYKTVARYRDAVVADKTLVCATKAETLAARIAFVETMEFKVKGQVDLISRKIFSDDTLDYFARALKRYSDMGWPMDYQAIRLMFSQAAAEMKLVDWKRGDCYVVSRSYVRKFVKSRPELRAYKAGHIDAVRAKKATVQVHEFRSLKCALCVARKIFVAATGPKSLSMSPTRCHLKSIYPRGNAGHFASIPSDPLLFTF